MECQKIIHLLDNTPNQSSKSRIKNRAEINNESRGTYNTNSQIRFETSMQKLGLCEKLKRNLKNCNAKLLQQLKSGFKRTFS